METVNASLGAEGVVCARTELKTKNRIGKKTTHEHLRRTDDVLSALGLCIRRSKRTNVTTNWQWASKSLGPQWRLNVGASVPRKFGGSHARAPRVPRLLQSCDQKHLQGYPRVARAQPGASIRERFQLTDERGSSASQPFQGCLFY